MAPTALDAQRLGRLLDAGRSLVAQLEVDAILQRLLETARDLTGARYAALGVLDSQRKQLERFLTIGVDEETQRLIGDPPRGRGVLGVLISEPKPLRLADVGAHPRSYGFPASHPPMTTFLGVPVLLGDDVWGNLYLTEKEGGAEFDATDEETAVVLAGWAAVAIGNARLYGESQARRADLERAVAGLEATTAIARAVGSETDLNRVLELIVKRGRALVEARAMVLLLAESDTLRLGAHAGQVEPGALGVRVPRTGTAVGDVLTAARPERIADVATRLALDDERLGVIGAETALLVPMVYRGTPLGVLAAFDRLAPDPGFGAEEESLVLAFAASAATAVATAKSVQRERLRESMAAAERERRRWARELHDETLQALGGLRVMLSSAARRGEAERLEAAVRDAVALLEGEISGLRRLITDLRPAALDELGLVEAIDGLRARVMAQEGIEISCTADLAGGRLAAELETAVYRIVQEALTNVVKHAHAGYADVRITRHDGDLRVRVADDGRGFAAGAPHAGFGLVGMTERAELLGGHVDVSSSDAGTVVEATIPIGFAVDDAAPGEASSATPAGQPSQEEVASPATPGVQPSPEQVASPPAAETPGAQPSPEQVASPPAAETPGAQRSPEEIASSPAAATRGAQRSPEGIASPPAAATRGAQPSPEEITSPPAAATRGAQPSPEEITSPPAAATSRPAPPR